MKSSDLAVALDRPLLMRRMGLEPDPWQIDFLRSTSKRLALLKARQVGGTSVLVARGLHRAAFFEGSTIGVLSPSLRQSCRLLRRIRRAVAHVPHIEATNSAVETLTLSNGSELFAWPGQQPDLIRGDSIDLLLADESAWISDAAFQTVLPMLAVTNGDAVLASSPGGPTGLMFEAWHDTEGEWDRVVVKASDCPRYSPEALAGMRRSLGESGYAQEFECEWREGNDAVFTSREIAEMLGLTFDPDQLPGESELPDDQPADLPTQVVLPDLSDLIASYE
ncbi:terminase large subunit domain-containing protein [Marmoricola sp. RAF53]|uniref:terminase large subunit domain-containing protein n=1 Tax=Marmoricola sp. RAF53 TaxID=3233059 RepID=UPI003F96D557